jgi:hypothetical protein
MRRPPPLPCVPRSADVPPPPYPLRPKPKTTTTAWDRCIALAWPCVRVITRACGKDYLNL